MRKLHLILLSDEESDTSVYNVRMFSFSIIGTGDAISKKDTGIHKK